MPIAITDEHQELGATVRGLLSAHDALGANRTLLEAEAEPRPSFWPEMAELGWLGVHLPEEHGGAGASLSELVVILEEIGRQVAPGPFLPTVLTSAVIARCGTPEQQAHYLPGLADGSRTAAVGLGGSLALEGGRLDGDGGIVLGGRAADVLLLRAGDDLVLVSSTADGLTLGGTKDIDPSRRSAAVTVSSVPVTAADVLTGAARPARALARTLGAAEAAGVLAACTDSAVAYAQERVQFGRTIGTFQAVKHHCADMLVASELATADGLGCRPRRRRPVGRVRPRRRHGGPPGLRAGRAQRADEHPGARRHRLHLGARRPSVPAPGAVPQRRRWARPATPRT